MAATNHVYSAPVGGVSSPLLAAAARLYALIVCGYASRTRPLGFSIQGGPALTELGADGRRRPVQWASGQGEGEDPARTWRPARTLQPGGALVDRVFNPWIVERHLRGAYSVAPTAPEWVSWVCLDIDAHPAAGLPEVVARREAKVRADRMLAGVWRALGLGADKLPVILRSPGGGYHLWFALTRGETSANREHTWPAAWARGWFERVFEEAGLDLRAGALEVYPMGRRLRLPCGRGQVLLRATRPDQPDDLGLEPWPGTLDVRVDWRGLSGELHTRARRVLPMVTTFCDAFESGRRTVAEWVGRPAAAWDRTWGFLGWRGDVAAGEGLAQHEAIDLVDLVALEKSGAAAGGECGPSQQSDDVPGAPRGRGVIRAAEPGGWAQAPGRTRRAGKARAGSSSLEPIDQISAADDPDRPPIPAGGVGVRGRAFFQKVTRLLTDGVTAPSSRHDAVFTLAFYWSATCGLPVPAMLDRVSTWCRAHAHAGSRISGAAFLEECRRDAESYATAACARWRFRGRGGAGVGVSGSLTDADHAVLSALQASVRDEAAAILCWLAGHADRAGQVSEPVMLAHGLLSRLCPERRVMVDGQRRRASVIAVEELVRLGVLTMHRNYAVGVRGREYSCWYVFGSGVLPIASTIAADEWASAAPAYAADPAPTLAIAATAEAIQDAPSAAPIAVRVVAERPIAEGLVRVLSDGTRTAPRTVLVPSAELVSGASSRALWWVRRLQLRSCCTVAEVRGEWFANVVPFPDVEARRRLSRADRLRLGGGAPIVPLRPRASARPAGARADQGAPSAGPAPDLQAAPGAEVGAVVPPSGSYDPDPAEALALASAEPLRAELRRARADAPARSVPDLRAELVAEVGAVGAELPIDVAEAVALAWRSLRLRDGD